MGSPLNLKDKNLKMGRDWRCALQSIFTNNKEINSLKLIYHTYTPIHLLIHPCTFISILVPTYLSILVPTYPSILVPTFPSILILWKNESPDLKIINWIKYFLQLLNLQIWNIYVQITVNSYAKHLLLKCHIEIPGWHFQC